MCQRAQRECVLISITQALRMCVLCYARHINSFANACSLLNAEAGYTAGILGIKSWTWTYWSDSVLIRLALLSMFVD